MGLLNVFEICTPRQDVLDGSISDSNFAANLSRVLRGDATPDYKDPKQFFANTYPTEGLKELLSNVCRRLSGNGQALSAVFRRFRALSRISTFRLAVGRHADGIASLVPFQRKPEMDWFESLFGFREGSYTEAQANFALVGQTLTSRANGRSWAVGELKMAPLAELRRSFRNAGVR